MWHTASNRFGFGCESQIMRCFLFAHWVLNLCFCPLSFRSLSITPMYGLHMCTCAPTDNKRIHLWFVREKQPFSPIAKENNQPNRNQRKWSKSHMRMYDLHYNQIPKYCFPIHILQFFFACSFICSPLSLRLIWFSTNVHVHKQNECGKKHKEKNCKENTKLYMQKCVHELVRLDGFLKLC